MHSATRFLRTCRLKSATVFLLSCSNADYSPRASLNPKMDDTAAVSETLRYKHRTFPLSGIKAHCLESRSLHELIWLISFWACNAFNDNQTRDWKPLACIVNYAQRNVGVCVDWFPDALQLNFWLSVRLIKT